MQPIVREWRPDWPCPVGQIWATWRKGAGDPTYRVDRGRHWRGIRTPLGPATLAVQPLNIEGVIVAEAWGEGAEWVLDQLPTMLGADDDPSGFVPRHPQLSQALREHPHWRLGRGNLVWQALLPAVIEQKVTGQEAFGGFRRLVHFHGERAPGPGQTLHLWVPPGPEIVRMIPSWQWLKLHIDPARSRTLVRCAQVADALERTLQVPLDEADTRLRSIAGVGVWTSAEVRFRAHGDADAVSFGDYHIAKEIGHALLGRDMDDAELAELLEPYRPHRHRVQALLGMRRWRERHGPRMAPRTHLPAN
ncbi:DNA-3-methyladenine glycosylase family protein [Micropruina glycogenica]|uniref:3-methyladenine DNA glycosylase n=1 Tax=Micropruina glycogenica TaxID=75385 RepID=A0A2N9JIJ2_9ACTN|nr:3-methyladenine DNA glycosylase [Micropruina glycogenica]SPD87884.1 3-methyladenine DNA glycosylase [Micropruina glycogenica]